MKLDALKQSQLLQFQYFQLLVDKPEIKITSSYHHTCLIDPSKSKQPRLACWGDDSQNQSTLPQVAKKDMPDSVEAGQNVTCVILRLSELFCWGNNQFGQADIPTLLLLLVHQVSLRMYHTCAHRITHEVICFGSNQYNQSLVPSKFKKNLNVIEVKVGGFHTCVLMINCKIECWGSNNSGQQDLPAVFSNAKWVNQLKLGIIHTCILQDSIQINCFGHEKTTVLKYPFDKQIFKPLIYNFQIGYQHHCLIKWGGIMVCWGQDVLNLFEFDNDWQNDIQDVAAGEKHNCVQRKLKDDFKNNTKVNCVGDNKFGQLNIPNKGILNDKFFGS